MAEDDITDSGQSRVELDVDARSGYGPETLTMANVPPGDYEIVVNRWDSSRGGGTAMLDVKTGNPRVNIYLGADGRRITCVPNPACRVVSNLWKVATIRVQDHGMNGANREYSVQVYPDLTGKIDYETLPHTADTKYTSTYSGGRYYKQYVVSGPQPRGSTDNVCTSTCEASDDIAAQCLHES